MTNEAHGSRSQLGYGFDMDGTNTDGRFLDTLDRRGNDHGFYSSSGSKRQHRHHNHHPYRKSEKQYLSKEFKKAKPPTFDGELKKL